MQQNTPCQVLSAVLSAVLLCGFAGAGTRMPAPQFTATTLDGQTFTNTSLRGDVVLLQFWTTWCPVCHQDQAAVDNVQADFGGMGLVVLAVDDGEPEAVVRKYLQANPRSCPVVVSDGHSLAARFGAHSYPHYVIIDRDGYIAVSTGGGGGEDYLRSLLRSVGMPPKAETVSGATAANRAAPPAGSGPQWTNVTGVRDTAKAKPLPKTIFVFASGERLEAEHYEIHATFLHLTAEGRERSIPLSALDIKKTVAVNRERGINLKIPTSNNEILLAF